MWQTFRSLAKGDVKNAHPPVITSSLRILFAEPERAD